MYLYRPTKRDQSGFSVIEALLVVLVIAALAIIGFLVYQHHKSSSTKNSAATSQTQTTTKPAQTTTQYLDITEWRVKLPLSSTISDAYYVPTIGTSHGSDGQPDQFSLGLKSLDSSRCEAKDNTTAIALIFRAHPTDTDSATGKLLTQEYPNGVTLGSYFYAYQTLKSSACKVPQATIQSVDAAFTVAAKGIISTITTQYFYINEWGIKAKPDDTFTLRYKIWPTSPNIAAFTSDQLTTASSNSGCGIGLTPDGMPYNHGGGFIMRLLPTDQVTNLVSDNSTSGTAEQFATDPQYAAFRSDIARAGGYYYVYYHEQGPCYDDAGNYQSNTENAVKNLLQSFQPISS